jgi:predicted transcriptional regulator
MAEQVEETMKVEHRTHSELMREALRTYFSVRRFPEETPRPAELRAIRRGEAAYRRGDYVILDEYLRDVDRRLHRPHKKVS